MLKAALPDCASNKNCCSVDWGRGICRRFSFPLRGIWQLNRVPAAPGNFAIQGKKKMLMHVGQTVAGGGWGEEREVGMDAAGIDWCIIGHFRVPKPLTFKMRPSAQPFMWKWILYAWEWKRIFMLKAEHLPSFWYSARGKLANSLFLTNPNSVLFLE